MGAPHAFLAIFDHYPAKRGPLALSLSSDIMRNAPFRVVAYLNSYALGDIMTKPETEG